MAGGPGEGRAQVLAVQRVDDGVQLLEGLLAQLDVGQVGLPHQRVTDVLLALAVKMLQDNFIEQILKFEKN